MSQTLIKYLLEGIFILVNIVFALIQNKIRLHDIKMNRTGGIKHGLWLAIYCVLMLGAWFLWPAIHSIWLMLAIGLEHLVIFNPIMNKLEKQDWFHLGTKSVVDRALAKIYKPVYIICALGFLVLQYVIYRYSF